MSSGADRMRIGYLWEVKEHEADPTPYRDLATSAVAEPTALLREHSEQFRDVLTQRTTTSNAFGQPLLREQIVQRYGSGAALDAHPTNGASGAIWLTCGALLRPGDDVIIEEPVYEPLLAVPEHLGARVLRIARKRSERFVLDVEELLAKVTARTRLIVISNLHNPSAAYIGPDALGALADRLRAVNSEAKVLVDETFLDHVPGAPAAASLDPIFISISTLSKVYGLSVLRCGWVLGAPDVVNTIRRYWVLVENSSSRLLEAMATIVFDRLEEYWGHGQAIIRPNRELVRSALQPLIKAGRMNAQVPEHGSMLFAEVPGLESKSFAERLRTVDHVLVAPGHHFGDPASLRIGYGRERAGLEEDLRTLVHAITHSP